MTLTTIMGAATSWPDAAIAIAGIALVTAVAVIVVQQGLATWRTRISTTREEAYRKLSEQTLQELVEINERLAELERANREAVR